MRARFEQGRALVFEGRAVKLETRIQKLQTKLNIINDKKYKHSEAAAGKRGLLGAMTEKGCDMMRVVDGACEFFKSGEGR